MATWTASTAIPSGGLITSAWMNNVTGMINFLGAANVSAGKDLFMGRQTTQQTITGGTAVPTALTFGAEDVDVAEGHSIITQTSRYTVKAAGKYRLTGSISIKANQPAQQAVGYYYKNGSLINTGTKGVFYIVNYASAEQQFIMPTVYTSLNTGDYVELYAYGSNASGFTTDVSMSQSTFGVEWVGA